MQKLEQTFLKMVVYAIVGIAVGAALGFGTGFILDRFYGQRTYGPPPFSSNPVAPAMGGLIGGVVSAVLVIKMSKGE